jgi:hypothetical protein
MIVCRRNLGHKGAGAKTNMIKYMAKTRNTMDSVARRFLANLPGRVEGGKRV